MTSGLQVAALSSPPGECSALDLAAAAAAAVADGAASAPRHPHLVPKRGLAARRRGGCGAAHQLPARAQPTFRGERCKQCPAASGAWPPTREHRNSVENGEDPLGCRRAAASPRALCPAASTGLLLVPSRTLLLWPAVFKRWNRCSHGNIGQKQHGTASGGSHAQARDAGSGAGGARVHSEEGLPSLGAGGPSKIENFPFRELQSYVVGGRGAQPAPPRALRLPIRPRRAGS